MKPYRHDARWSSGGAVLLKGRESRSEVDGLGAVLGAVRHGDLPFVFVITSLVCTREKGSADGL